MKLILPRRLSTRLIVSHLLVGVFSIALITAISITIIHEGGRRDIENSLSDLALNISNNLELPFIDLRSTPAFEPSIRQVMSQSIPTTSLIEYILFSADGSPLLASPQAPAELQIERLKTQLDTALKGNKAQLSLNDPQKGEVFFTLAPITHLGVQYGALLLVNPYAPNLEDTRLSLISMLIISWLVLVAVALGAYLIARSFNRPIRSLTHMAQRISAGDFHARAEVSGPAELEQLAATFNQMAAQLQDNIDGMRAFVANASHELRTPLTAMQLNTEALLTGAVEDPTVSRRFLLQLEDEIDLMTRTVNDLLDLSRIEANRNLLAREKLDLNALISEMSLFWHHRLQQAELALHINPSPVPALILGHEDQLRRLLNNLIDNAIKNTPSGGWVEVNLYTVNPGRLRLEVCDNGRGIAEEHLPHLFERFYRIESPSPQSKTTGTGLGLAIVKSIVEAHQAQIGVFSKVSKGTTFWVEFHLESADKDTADLKGK